MAAKRSTSVSAPSLSTSQTLQHCVAIAIAVIAVAVRFYVLWRTHFTAPEAHIALQYAENIAAGRGFVYNIGDHVFAVNGPLYSLMLSLISSPSSHLNPIFVGKACSIAADGVTCYLLARLLALKDIARPVEGLFASALYSFSSLPVVISISGTETGLAVCVGMAMVYAYVSGRPYWLYTLGAVLFLIRYDGLMLFATLAAALAIRERKFQLRPGAIALIIIIPWLIFSMAYFGSPIPHPLSTQPYGFTQNVTTDTSLTKANVHSLTTQFLEGWIPCALAFLFALGAILVMCQAIIRRERGVMVAPMLWCGISVGLVFVARWPVGMSYYAPVWPVYLAVATLAAATAPIKFAKMRPDLAASWAGRAVPAALAALLFIGITQINIIILDVATLQAVEATRSQYQRLGMSRWEYLSRGSSEGNTLPQSAIMLNSPKANNTTDTSRSAE
jgi:Gpi18-like mannosyltransferase